MWRWASERVRFERARRAALRALHAPSPPAASDPNLSRPAANRQRDGHDVVLVPCWRRPEMLWHCLDNLSKADGIAAMHVAIRADDGYDPDVLHVVAEFSQRFGSCEMQLAPVCPHRRTKLSANILFGYLHAAARSPRHVYLVEEDIMVGRDFFRWHQAVQAAQPHLFCSIAVRNHNRTVQCPDDPQGYYLSSGDYCSWGVCFERSVLIDLVARHVSHDYLARPKAYLRRHFSASRVSLGFVEQASLLRRIQERCGRPIVYPAVPRAFHAGFYGRNRPGAVCGGLESKVRELNDVIYDPVAMRRVAVNERYADDSVPVNLQLHTQAEPRQIRPLEVA